MALTDAQTATLNQTLGPGTWDDDDPGVEVRLARLGNIQFVAREIAEERLALLRQQPAQFTLPGDYQQSTAENIHALERLVASLPAGPGSAGAVRIIRPVRGRWR